MNFDVLKQAQELRERGEPFVLATVVAYRRPQSAKPGSKAIIRQDGSLIGWVGGGCVQPILTKEAQKVLESGRPSLIIISPESVQADWQGITEYRMSCQGGGSLQIYLEPMLPKPQLMVFGSSPVAQTLAHLGEIADFKVETVSEYGTANINPAAYVIIATMGDSDEEALMAAVQSEAVHVGFVGSREKFQSLVQYLKGKGVDAKKIERIKCPAGLEIGAETLPEIAFSIMAELIQLHKQTSKSAKKPAVSLNTMVMKEAVDPICGMTVAIASAKHTSSYQGKNFYFCCLRCKETFEHSPSQYAQV